MRQPIQSLSGQHSVIVFIDDVATMIRGAIFNQNDFAADIADLTKKCSIRQRH